MGADLIGVDLSEADLSNAKITVKQLSEAMPFTQCKGISEKMRNKSEEIRASKSKNQD